MVWLKRNNVYRKCHKDKKEEEEDEDDEIEEEVVMIANGACASRDSMEIISS